MLRYLSQNAGCNSFNPILYLETGGGRVPLEFIEIYRLPAGLSSQTVKIPVDKYEPGRCLWKPVELATGEFDSRFQSYKLSWSTGYPLDSDGPKAVTAERICRDFKAPPTNGKTNVILTCDVVKEIGPLNPSGSALTGDYKMSADR